MSKKLPCLLAFAACAALLLVACGGGASNNANTANSSNTKTGNTNAAATPAATATTTASTGDKLGIPECDDYIAKYEACVNGKVPENLRATVKTSLETARNAWRQAAANPATRGTLAAQCKAAHDTARQSMASYGCSW